MATNSLSNVLYFRSVSVSLREKNPNGFPFCSNTDPIAKSDASVVMVNSFPHSGVFRGTTEVSFLLASTKAVS